MTDGIFAIIKFMLKCNLAHNKYKRRWDGRLECAMRERRAESKKKKNAEAKET